MANYDSSLFSKQDIYQSQTKSPGLQASLYAAQAVIALDNAAATNDVLRFFYLPPGAEIIDMSLNSDDLDSNVGPAITIDIGDATVAQRWFAASTIGQAGGTDRNVVKGGLGYVIPVGARVLVQGLIHLQAATKQAGSVTLTCFYRLVGNATS